MATLTAPIRNQSPTLAVATLVPVRRETHVLRDRASLAEQLAVSSGFSPRRGYGS